MMEFEKVILGESKEANQHAMEWGLKLRENEKKSEEARKKVLEWMTPLFEEKKRLINH